VADINEIGKADDLIEKLGVLKPRDSYTCEITVENDCPSDWDVNIIAAGCKFFYSDGTDYTDPARQIDLHSGGTATFISNSSTKCVMQFVLAMTVQARSDPAQNMVYQDGAAAGQCLLHETRLLTNRPATGRRSGG
jgi:hypothetical protein